MEVYIDDAISNQLAVERAKSEDFCFCLLNLKYLENEKILSINNAVKCGDFCYTRGNYGTAPIFKIKRLLWAYKWRE